ncbi:hypothetical protein [Ghiorsea bivora]|uniref:hypothetical protein n=1 Tax=Ghiorsea bivora TaxID=1485545 RepID=UPI00056FB2E2|nr:hypothetical protein [Ghiorsea bivora]
MGNNKDTDVINKLIHGSYIEKYKASSVHLFSKKNRGVYWGTSLMMVALTFSLYVQGYVLETWAILMLLSLLLLVFAMLTFRRSQNVVEFYLDKQMPKISSKNEQVSNEGFKLFMQMSDLLDMMKIERQVVWHSTAQIWLIFVILLMSYRWLDAVVLVFLSLYVAIALVSAMYGAMAMVHLQKCCIYASEHGFNR